MKKLLAFGLLFCSGILISPAIAIHGIDHGSNCQFQLPYTMEELIAIRNHISLGKETTWHINIVNGCTNRNEKLQVKSISEDATTFRLDGYLADETGKMVQRRILIAKTDAEGEILHQANWSKILYFGKIGN